MRVKDALHPHLRGKVGLVELDRHQIALLDADAVLAGEAAADLNAKPEDVGAEALGLVEAVEEASRG